MTQEEQNTIEPENDVSSDQSSATQDQKVIKPENDVSPDQPSETHKEKIEETIKKDGDGAIIQLRFHPLQQAIMELRGGGKFVDKPGLEVRIIEPTTTDRGKCLQRLLPKE
ncbi:MAG: hypothetical protein QNJ46_30340 [Leptolyngbyaceae cyanobacterium MO_188.B28]|nr:hypothetical protein [Leptolyngbyaceae cyanobacterium MO_188.B28]